MLTRLGDALAHPWLTVRVQIALGVFFVAAALPKILDPPGFVHMIYNYRLVPGALLNVFGLVLPWLEILLGLALVLGIWRRTATAGIAGLLLVFIVAISINLLRDNPIDCGCFDVSSANKTEAERFFDMKMVILRDIGMLVMAAQSLWAEARRER